MIWKVKRKKKFIKKNSHKGREKNGSKLKSKSIENKLCRARGNTSPQFATTTFFEGNFATSTRWPWANESIQQPSSGGPFLHDNNNTFTNASHNNNNKNNQRRWFSNQFVVLFYFFFWFQFFSFFLFFFQLINFPFFSFNFFPLLNRLIWMDNVFSFSKIPFKMSNSVLNHHKIEPFCSIFTLLRTLHW